MMVFVLVSLMSSYDENLSEYRNLFLYLFKNVITALGAYYIFGPLEWALIRGGRLLNFHRFQQV